MTMTVGELKEILESYDDDLPVYIGMEQTYGSNWAYDIRDIWAHTVSPFDDDKETAVVITEGSQVGTVKYEYEEE